MLLVNDSEARLLTGQRSLLHAARAIQAMGPGRVIVKKGEHGALFFGRESVLAVPAIDRSGENNGVAMRRHAGIFVSWLG